MIDQTTFYDPEAEDPNKGNCTEAAVASILGLQLSEVPRFHQEGGDAVDFWSAFEDFLTGRGLYVLREEGNFVPECMYLASGPSKRGCKHMVVMQDGKLVHDPHPSRAGLLSVDFIHLLIPKDLRGKTVRQGCGLGQGMKIAEAGMKTYAQEHPRWWRKIDGTPIPNDLGVHIGQAIAAASRSGLLK